MCIIFKDKRSLHTFTGCERDAQVWRDWAEKTTDASAKAYLIAAAATVEHLAKYLTVKVNQ